MASLFSNIPFYCNVYYRSLRFISFKATIAKEKEYLGNDFFSSHNQFPTPDPKN